MAYIWDMDQNLRGKLLQGYMMKPDYRWDFPLSTHESYDSHVTRLEAAKKRLDNAREERNTKDRQYQKLAMDVANNMENMRSSLGFQDSTLKSLLGVGNDVSFT